MDKKKTDPISKLYFNPLETIEKVSDYLFYISAFLSFLLLLVNKVNHPKIYDNLQVLFIISVIVLALLGLANRLYFSPRAQSKRFQDFISSAYNINLTPDRTEGYYNNTASTPAIKMGAQLLENAFHSKDTIHLMTIKTRWFFGIYLLVFVLLVLNRNSNLEFISFVAQIIFGEQVLSKWIRLEWTRREYENIFIGLYQLLAKKLEENEMLGSILEMLQRYEVAKATTGITLSKSIFEKRNDEVSKEWEIIRSSLNL